MQLHLHANAGTHFVRSAGASTIVLNSGEQSGSFLLTPERGAEALSAQDVDGIDATHIERILGHAPEVVLLGTGRDQRFPAPALMAQFLSRGVGLEVMNNTACARTYNVLASEGRKVLAVFLLSGRV